MRTLWSLLNNGSHQEEISSAENSLVEDKYNTLLISFIRFVLPSSNIIWALLQKCPNKEVHLNDRLYFPVVTRCGIKWKERLLPYESKIIIPKITLNHASLLYYFTTMFFRCLTSHYVLNLGLRHNLHYLKSYLFHDTQIKVLPLYTSLKTENRKNYTNSKGSSFWKAQLKINKNWFWLIVYILCVWYWANMQTLAYLSTC